MRRVHAAAGVAALLIAGGVAVAGRGVVPGPALLVRTVAVGAALGRVALDEQSGRAFVLDHQTNSVRVLDAATGTSLRAIAAGAYPALVALDARRGHVFVAAWADDAVRMLDAATGIVRRVVALGQGPGPGGMALDARTGRLFVSNYGAGTVRVLDTASGRLLRTVRVGGAPRRLAVDERTGRVFMVHNDERGHTLLVLDARDGAVRRRLRLDRAPGPAYVAVDARAGRAVVVNTLAGTVTTLDTRRLVVVRSSAVGGAPRAVAVDERTGRVFVAESGVAAVAILDSHTGALVRVVRVGAGPFPLTVDRPAGHIVVASWGQPVDPRTWYWSPDAVGRPTAGSVSPLDARTGDVVRQIATGPIPLVVAVDERRGRAVVTNAGGTAVAPAPWAWVPSWLRDRTHGLIPAPSGPRALPGNVSGVDARR
jgi:YVTN family beta-propeller protein